MKQTTSRSGKDTPVKKNSDENLRPVSQGQQHEDQEDAQPEEATQRTIRQAVHKTILVDQKGERQGESLPYQTVQAPHRLASTLLFHSHQPFKANFDTILRRHPHTAHHASMARVWIEVTHSLTDRTRNRQPTNSLSPHTHHQAVQNLDVSQSAVTTQDLIA